MTAIGGGAPVAQPATGNGSSGGGQATAGADGGFARMLEGKAASGDPAAGAAPGKAATQTDPSNHQADGQRVDSGAGDRRGQASSGGQAAPGPQETAPAPAADTAAAGEQATTPADTATADIGWPPPGLASLLDPAALAAPMAVPPATAAAVPALPAQALGELPPQPAAAPTMSAASAAATVPMPMPMPGTAGLASTQPPTAASPAAAAAATATAGGESASSQALASLLPAFDAAAGVDAAGADRTPSSESAAPAPGFALPSATPPGTATAAPAAPPFSAAQAPVPQLHGEAFADDIGSHVQWLAGQKIGHAHIRISPQELGPVEVRLQLDGDRISADFSSAQAETRQALENSLPRLREMLGQHGFQLAHAGVGQQARQDGGGQGAPSGRAGGDGADAVDEEAATPAPARAMRRGLLDAYA